MSSTLTEAPISGALKAALGGFEPENPDYPERVKDIFERASFVTDMGIRYVDCGPGWCESSMTLGPNHLQQDEFIHAGVLSTIADHTAGAAAATMMPLDRIVLTVEYKINLLRPAMGESLRCRADLLKCGRRLIIAESSVYATNKGREKLVAKAMVTLAPV